VSVKEHKISTRSWALVAHTCNPRRRSGESRSKPAQANRSARPILKKSHYKKGLVEWLKV
jgi:hypothetical protein